MQRTPVQSSDIVSVGFNAEERILEIEFKEGRIYQYHDVPVNIYEGLIAAKSPGRYFFSYINAYFRYRRVNSTSKTKDKLQLIGKESELANFLQAAGIEIEITKIDLPKIEAREASEVWKDQVESAHQRLNAPILLARTSWAIPALNGFPGALDIAAWLQADDFANLLKDQKDQRVIKTNWLIYKDNQKLQIFSEEVRGVWRSDVPESAKVMDDIVIFDAAQPQPKIWHDFVSWYKRWQKIKRLKN